MPGPGGAWSGGCLVWDVPGPEGAWSWGVPGLGESGRGGAWWRHHAVRILLECILVCIIFS